MQRKIIGAAVFAVALALASAACPATAATTADKGKNNPADHQKVNTAGFSFRIERTPAWVVPVKEETGVSLPKASMHYALIDDQTRVEATSRTDYAHLVRVVDDNAGLATAASIEMVFDPSYQALVLHKFEIVRGGKRIDKLDRKKVQLLQRETQLEAQMYDGRVTASIVLDDVRVGDTIEYSYSVEGQNPVFDGKLVDTEWLVSEKGPVALGQFRLLAPADRAIASRAGADVVVTSAVSNGLRDTRFRRTAIAQLQYDNRAPVSAFFDQQIQLSEFADWTAVRRWGDKLFAAPGPVAPAITARADAIRAAAPTPELRLLAALTLVQTEIRYFGTEIGASSHLPAAPAAVLEQRFGDCKDKVALLLALLKALDIEAAPVLVSTDYRGDVALMLPGPAAFNHAIARVNLDGKTYWLDATRGQQTGPLAQRQSIGLGKALVLDGAATALDDLPDGANEERVAVSDVFHMAKMADDPVLESRITYSGEMAELFRGGLAATPIDKIESELVADYVRIYPTLRMSAPMRIEEQAGKNAVTVVQQFTVPGFWRFPEQRALVADVALWSFIPVVQVPNDPARKLPFRLTLPGIYRHTVAVDYPDEMYRNSDTRHVDLNDPHFTYQLAYQVSPRRMALSAELDILKDTVAVADWAAYNDKLLKLRPRLFGVITALSMTLPDMDKLGVQSRALMEAINKGANGAHGVSKVQATARLRIAGLTAQLDGGFLNPRLRAEALVQRGEQRDALDQTGLARIDYDEAMRLVPDNAETITSAAINGFLDGDDARARALGLRALQLAPSDLEPDNTLGLVDYFASDYRAAAQRWTLLLAERSYRERVYPTILLYFASRRNGEDGAAAVQKFLPTSATPPWPYPVLQWMTGAADYDQAAKVAAENPKDLSRLCELYFYAGEKFLLDGNPGKAREYFRKTIDTGVVEFMEYKLAQRELARMAY
jgi:transglutaminase-like putative cysteine protease/lipoprotein NlpI